MYKVFFGTDSLATQKALHDAIENAKKTHSEAILYRFDDVSSGHEGVLEAISSPSMFGGVNIVILNGLLEEKGGAQFYPILRTVEEGRHIVLIREGKLSPEFIKLFKEIGAEIKEFSEKVQVRDQGVNFALADAVAGKDKKNAWVHLEVARKNGVSPEEIHGAIFWCMKNLYIVSSREKKEALASGVKDFTYGKYQNYTKKYLSGDIEKKLGELKDIYHKGHESNDLEIRIEEFILNL